MTLRTLTFPPSSEKWNRSVGDLRWQGFEGLRYLTSRELQDQGFRLAFSSRVGGSSRSPYDSLNLSLAVGDDIDCVLNNRRLLSAALEIEPLMFTTAEQIHGAEVVRVNRNAAGRGAVLASNALEGADALITAETGIPLILFFADCIPIVLIDVSGRAVGLAHAGREGTLLRLAERLVMAMGREFGSRPEALVAYLGPGIGSCCYQVDKQIASAFSTAFSVGVGTRDGAHYLDLATINKFLLEDSGLLPKRIHLSGMCTCCRGEDFFSYRRDGLTGRQAATLTMI